MAGEWDGAHGDRLGEDAAQRMLIEVATLVTNDRATTTGHSLNIIPPEPRPNRGFTTLFSTEPKEWFSPKKLRELTASTPAFRETQVCRWLNAVEKVCTGSISRTLSNRVVG
jgi:hypothetical protein